MYTLQIYVWKHFSYESDYHFSEFKSKLEFSAQQVNINDVKGVNNVSENYLL